MHIAGKKISVEIRVNNTKLTVNFHEKDQKFSIPSLHFVSVYCYFSTSKFHNTIKLKIL